MCGIAGWAGPTGLNGDALRAMCDAVQHRGPDDDGGHLEPGRVGLGFRRLSIIDLDTGAQPLSNESGSVVATCNGEIYNFRELRDELRVRGHEFRTGSDCETIVHLYEEDGPDFVQRLQGMFGIALWDRDAQRLVLARDRIGVKPLYWASSGPAGLLYGSEPGCILASGLIPAEPDPAAIMQYLALQYVPPPLSGFKGINKLAPGERLIHESGRTSVERYWSLPTLDERRSSEGELLDQLDDLLRRATHERMIADVPLGAFLSGGIDSSLVVSYMAEATDRVRTFSIDFPELGYSETKYAQQVAELYGTDHQELLVEPEMVPTVAEAVRYAGEPFADSSAIPTYLLCEMARSQVTVALSGDGGDEAFGGYWRYGRLQRLDRLGAPGRAAGRAVERVAGGLVRRRAPGLLPGLQALAQDSHDRNAGPLCHFTPDELARLCTPAFVEAAGGTRRAWDEVLALPPGRDLNRYMSLDVETYLPGDVLTKVDRMSMAHALEVRSPLLDYRVQEFAARVPGALKVDGRETKRLLRTLARRRGLSEEIVGREKKGFSIPVGIWFRGELRSWVSDVLLDPQTTSRGYFDKTEVEGILDRHVSGEQEHSSKLWNLAMLELWHRAWVDAPAGVDSSVEVGPR